MTVLPGRTIGILGGGQLGRMLCVEARRMGYRTIVLDPTRGCPASQTADSHIPASLDDVQAALDLADQADALTLEWELIPADVLQKIEAVKPVYPGSAVLGVIQDRLVQKNFLRRHGFPTAEYRSVESAAQADEAAAAIGYPCVLKRRRHGYDGKGQARLAGPGDLAKAEETLKAPCILETHVPFAREISVILARGQDGKTAVYPIAENVHRDGILHTTRAPAPMPAKRRAEAARLATRVARALGHVGVMAVEMFETEDRTLLVNEIAPRVHNSGHYTLGACATSQFEQHLRAVGGLPLGDPSSLRPAVMVNLLGELWAEGEPNWEILGAYPQARLHLYGKAKAAPGRKMGHVLLIDRDTDAQLELADRLIAELAAKPRVQA